jgi:hypothetical protein
MKDIESLKKEQYDAKAKLHEIIELINGEEYYILTPSEKSLIAQQRVGLEIYLGSLTKQLYDKDGCSFDASSAMWPLLMSNMFTSSSGFGPSSSLESLKKQLEEEDFEVKKEYDESGCSD